ncbi:hypothetical protein U9M48_024775 [Paspalum notatum var. saurae]|uniref:Integrase catalytic domain-containing protein n=1 Tax=Paspalum notatum var. saurae TaxID=547442 RepID=A0AAQ3TP05_PASNO
MDYNPIVSSIVTKTKATSFADLSSQLLSFEQRISLYSGCSQSSVNAASCGGRGRGSRGRMTGRGRGDNRNRGDYSNTTPRSFNNGGRGGYNNTPRQKPRYQVCFKEGHTAGKCWHRYEEDYVPEERHTAAAYSVDTNWYTDIGATDHITSELNKLTMREKYNGGDQIHTASGSGPAPDSVSRKKYYVSFIDDFSKFTWLYLIKHKSEVFKNSKSSKV